MTEKKINSRKRVTCDKDIETNNRRYHMEVLMFKSFLGYKYTSWRSVFFIYIDEKKTATENYKYLLDEYDKFLKQRIKIRRIDRLQISNLNEKESITDRVVKDVYERN